MDYSRKLKDLVSHQGITDVEAMERNMRDLRANSDVHERLSSRSYQQLLLPRQKVDPQ